MKVEFFDPPMCCPTGICGPSVDPELLRIQEAILTLKNQGVTVERYGLSHQIQMFMTNEAVAELLNKNGVEVLPITVINGAIYKTGDYPTIEEVQVVLGLK